MISPVVNISALEPLFAPHEEPTKHRVRAQREGDPAEIVPIRRPSRNLHCEQPPACCA